MESQEDADLQLERSTPASRASKHLIPFPHGPFETRPRNELLSIVGCSYVDSCSLTRSFHQRHHPLWITDNTNEGLWKPRIAFLSSSQLDTLSPTLTAPLRVRDCATPDPSALHPFCSGAAPHNGCSATQRVQRHTTGTANHNRHTATQHSNGTARNQAPTATQHSNGSSGPQRSTTRHHTPPQQAQHKQQCTRSVGITPLLFGCSAPQRVQRHATGAAPRNGCLPSDLCPARRRICNDDNSQTLDERGGSYCFRPQHQPWHPVHRHATNRRSRHRTRRRPASCPPARDQPMLLRAAVAAFKTGVAVSQPSERYETVRHDAIASSCRSFLHVANAEEPTATATATAETIAPLEAWDARGSATSLSPKLAGLIDPQTLSPRL